MSFGGKSMESKANDFGLGPIGQIAITVQDLERATAFYRDRLGMRLLFQVPGMAFFDCAGIRLMLGVPEKPGQMPVSSLLYFRVEDIAQAHEVLSARGVLFEQGPHLVARLPDHELWLAFLRDADQNLLALMSEVRPAASQELA
jgi:methylmalonyl-CoA/ethylmalonyl-CoA epimerase